MSSRLRDTAVILAVLAAPPAVANNAPVWCQHWQDIHYCADNRGNTVYERNGYLWTHERPHDEPNPDLPPSPWRRD